MIRWLFSFLFNRGHSPSSSPSLERPCTTLEELVQKATKAGCNEIIVWWSIAEAPVDPRGVGQVVPKVQATLYFFALTEKKGFSYTELLGNSFQDNRAIFANAVEVNTKKRIAAAEGRYTVPFRFYCGVTTESLGDPRYSKPSP